MSRSGMVRPLSALAVLALVSGCSIASDVASDKQPSATPLTAATPATSASQGPGNPSPTPTPGATTSPTSPATNGGLPKGFGPGPAGHGLARFYDQKVTWSRCNSTEQCASIWVPLDYSKPGGTAITIKAARTMAGEPSKRVGSLLINPGGPGGSGISYLSYIKLDPAITNVYDVVGFDPRGVGASTPVDCVSNQALDQYIASDPSPNTAQEIQQFQHLWTSFTNGCVQNSGPLLHHVSTIEVARDMDIIRAVVKDPRLNYFGASYGTYIGATYAALFPKQVGRMVLDGAVDPLASPHQTEIAQSAGFETALRAYLQYCVDRGSCPLGNSVAAAEQRLVTLLKQIDAKPLPTASGRRLTEGLAFLGIIVPLYSRSYWSYETTALQQAVNGQGDVLLALADSYASRRPDGTYADNALEVQEAVNCLDHPEHATLAQIEQGKGAFLKTSPVFGPVSEWWPYSCSYWPVKPTLPRPDYHAPGAAPIVVVGTTRDPATPYQQAVRLSQELDSGVLLSRNGDGHTAYASGNQCIDHAVDTYLVSGRPPADRTRC